MQLYHKFIMLPEVQEVRPERAEAMQFSEWTLIVCVIMGVRVKHTTHICSFIHLSFSSFPFRVTGELVFISTGYDVRDGVPPGHQKELLEIK